jgi:hypothetical protein
VFVFGRSASLRRAGRPLDRYACGVTRARSGGTVAPEAASAEVEGLDGRKVPLATLWRERTVVLVFLRHFG